MTTPTEDKFLNLIFTYAGDPDAALIFFSAIWKVAVTTRGNFDEDDLIQSPLESALRLACRTKDAKHVEALIGVQTKKELLFYRTKGNRLVQGTMECIGAGDSSVIHYLSDMVPPPILGIGEATKLAVYLVSLANRYIDGCGFGANAAIIRPKGPLILLGKQQTARYADGFANFERQMEKEFFRVA